MSFYKFLFLQFVFFSSFLNSYSQQVSPFSRYDSLKGSDGPFRRYNVNYYDLNLKIDIHNQSIAGSNKIHFTSESQLANIQIDLSNSYTIDSIKFNTETVRFSRDSSHIIVHLVRRLDPGEQGIVEIYYNGIPPKSENPPWDGGFIWSKDSLGRNWIGVACEGIGASSWWPCKDYWGDEPDSVSLNFSVPDPLTCISNGTLVKKEKQEGGYTRYVWNVNYPINTYNITFNLAYYQHFSDTLKSLSGKKLPLDYYVLDYNIQKAKKHFDQVKLILNTFENLFSWYPFQEDGYALVETPYWGMEHQSCVAYGNNFVNNLLDLDYIIVHETAHEWWGNSLTAHDHGAMWIHESFATYSEALLLEKVYKKEVAVKYLQSQKLKIKNQHPIAGPLHVNYHNYEDTDMYFKGAWMLHTIRNIINNDSLWFNLIRDFASKYRYAIVDRQTVVSFFNKYSGLNLNSVFSQYLDYKELPCLEYKFEKKKGKTLFRYKWVSPVQDLVMPLEIKINQEVYRIHPSNEFQYFEVKGKLVDFEVNQDKFLINLTLNQSSSSSSSSPK